MTGEKKKKKRLNRSVLLAKKIVIRDGAGRQGIGEPSVYHAVVVIFLEFFAWGLLTTPMLTVLHQTFPQHTFLMNGLIHGVKSLRKVGQDSTVLLICITVFLSYLPEAGQYSSFFLYLRQVIGFSSETVAAFIGVVGILSILAQTVVLGILMRSIGNKNTILLGLGFQILQLAWYGFGSQPWMMWAAGAVAAMSSITFPAISAMVSRNADPDQQGVVQGMITGIRGLCNGLGPALYGFVFYLFHVELNEMAEVETLGKASKPNMANPTDESSIIPGPPFLFGACSVLLSLLVALFIPEHNLALRSGSHKKHSNGAQTHAHSPQAGGAEGKEPLLEDSSV
ncbi:hippocampus abundant transcript 1 protein-like isoform X3 [Rissa tridactyla]|uniref:hippocampus abundant transcript 1 protein-like isoform X3 n=1 Tax=Rissa tridactyla TaxID=75485 RepID=UPI0023BA89A0|nr:hippocampus abundant transcript 1 protein-like isoform X3 [Rissa tridactyla]